MSQELKPFRVTIAHDACTTHDVQATDKHDAMVKAHDEASVTLCHQCSNEIEMGDPLRALSVEDLTTGETDDEIEPHWEVASLRAKVAELEAEIARTHQPEAAQEWEHLKRFGYAPGNYMSICVTCQKAYVGLDKRATRCHPCAEAEPAIAFHPTQDPISSTDGTTHGLGCGSSGGQASVAVAYTTKLHNTQSNQAGKVYQEYATSIDANSPPPALLTAMQVRRLTPVECERLQGFPDGYTEIPWRKKPASECPDGPRYRALGNSWPTNVVRWLGRRIDRQIKQLEPA